MPEKKEKHAPLTHRTKADEIYLDVLEIFTIGGFILALLMNKSVSGIIAFGVGALFGFLWLHKQLKSKSLAFIILPLLRNCHAELDSASRNYLSFRIKSGMTNSGELRNSGII